MGHKVQMIITSRSSGSRPENNDNLQSGQAADPKMPLIRLRLRGKVQCAFLILIRNYFITSEWRLYSLGRIAVASPLWPPITCRLAS